jgi:hypothetical protein
MNLLTEVGAPEHREVTETSKNILKVFFKRNIPAIKMKCLTELGSYFVTGLLCASITLGPILCCF